MLTYTVQGSYCGTPEIIKPLKTTHNKHVLMESWWIMTPAWPLNGH